MPDVVSLVARWTRGNNRRRLTEEAMSAAASLALLAAAALLVHRLGWALARAGIQAPGWMPDGSGLAQLAAVLAGAGGVAVLVRGVARYRRRRLNPLQMAREVDAAHDHACLLSTALAIEAGTAAGSPDAHALVHARAQLAAKQITAPVRRIRPPKRLIAGAGVAVAASVAGLVLLSGDIAFGQPDTNANTAEADPVADAPPKPPVPLSDETKARLAEALARLERFENKPALRPLAQESLAEAREHLRKALSNPKRTLGSLSRAEQALRRLAKQARDTGLLDQEQIEQMSTEDLAEQMSQAMEEQDHQTASELGQELARRMEDASMSELRSMSRAFERHFKPTDSAARPGAPSTGPKPAETAKERAERWKKSLEEMTESMRRGESGMSSAGMRDLADELRRSGASGMERSLDEALSEIRKAREGRLGEMGGGKPGEGKPGEGKPGEGKPGEGMGGGKPGEGKPGEGIGGGKPGEGESGGAPGEGPPGGKPGPGGGSGSFAHGSMGFLPPGVGDKTRVDTPKVGPDGGAIRIIQRISAGRRDAVGQYRDLHQQYEAVAEAAVRREQIPLTRREYIRDYFEAVRPQ